MELVYCNKYYGNKDACACRGIGSRVILWETKFLSSKPIAVLPAILSFTNILLSARHDDDSILKNYHGLRQRHIIQRAMVTLEMLQEISYNSCKRPKPPCCAHRASCTSSVVAAEFFHTGMSVRTTMMKEMCLM